MSRGMPIALLDVLGRPLLHRVTERFTRYGVSGVTVVGDAGPHGGRFLRRALGPEVRWEQTPGDGLWRTAQRVFTDYAASGTEVVLVMRLGPMPNSNSIA